MPSFKDKLKKMASDKQIAAHPLVEKLNANQSTRSSYWLAFALYAKVEEQDLDALLIELGKSLKLDESEIKDELSAVKECSSDEDFESLVQECAGGLTDAAVKILLFAELNQFGRKHKMSLDFLTDMMNILEAAEPEKDFIGKFMKIVNSTKPNLMDFYDLTRKFPEVPSFIYETFVPELWAQCNKDFTKEASELLKKVSAKPSFDPSGVNWWLEEYDRDVAKNRAGKESISFLEIVKCMRGRGCGDPLLIFLADQSAMEKQYKAVEDAFVKKHSDVPLPLVKKQAFRQYREKLQTLFAKLKQNYIPGAEPGYGGILEFDDKLFDIVVLRCYMRFSAGLKEQFLDDGWRFWKIDQSIESAGNWEEASLNKARQAAMKELTAINAVYEKENEELSAFFN